VQLLKHHRDIYFEHITEEVVPISIIITTLAARSYEYCVKMSPFDTELDVLLATIRKMPDFIERPVLEGRVVYWVPNETTQGENFADRWNTEPGPRDGLLPVARPSTCRIRGACGPPRARPHHREPAEEPRRGSSPRHEQAHRRDRGCASR
jgi:hypothetical protein